MIHLRYENLNICRSTLYINSDRQDEKRRRQPIHVVARLSRMKGRRPIAAIAGIAAIYDTRG